MHHFAVRSEAGSLHTTIETKELYHVWLDADTKPDHVNTEAGNITKDGFLALSGNALVYTMGEAIKKVRMFNGVIKKTE
jgi:hypothetical protein